MIAGGHSVVDGDDDDDKVGVSFCLNSSNRAVRHHKHTHNSNYTPLSSFRVYVCVCLSIAHLISPLSPRHSHFYLIYSCLSVGEPSSFSCASPVVVLGAPDSDNSHCTSVFFFKLHSNVMDNKLKRNDHLFILLLPYDSDGKLKLFIPLYLFEYLSV